MAKKILQIDILILFNLTSNINFYVCVNLFFYFITIIYPYHEWDFKKILSKCDFFNTHVKTWPHASNIIREKQLIADQFRKSCDSHKRFEKWNTQKPSGADLDIFVCVSQFLQLELTWLFNRRQHHQNVSKKY